MKYTFFYIIGGDDKYYNQLYRSLRSLSRLDNQKFKVKILDFDKKFNFETNLNIELININEKIDKKELYWKYKYFICQNIDTEYGIYLDCDTVICYDRLNEIEKIIGENFGVITHFYIKNFNIFSKIFDNTTFNYLGENDLFFTGGVFLFYNNLYNIETLKKIFDLHDKFDINQSKGFYDETFLSLILSNRNKIIMNGSFNHCSANYMPLKVVDDALVGKNEFDQDFEKIFILHGSSKRQFDGEDFTNETKEKIKNFWLI